VNKKNVFRGLHINTFAKLITCISGQFIDIMVNMITFEVKYYTIYPGDQIYCPANYAHGFISLEENSVLSYHCEGYFGSEIGGLLNYKDPILNINLPVPDSELIMNEKDMNAPFLSFDYFMIGHRGYIGNHIYNELLKQDKKVYALPYRMENLEYIKKLLQFYKPKYFINAAGLTGVPNTLWCNEHKRETLMSNVINQINIANVCNELNIHCTMIGSGAIFKTSSNPVMCDTIGNIDTYNNYYAKCRIYLEEHIQPFKNVLLLRVNYPLSSIPSTKNLLYKMLKYEKVDDISLSVTNLNSMVPLIPQMIEENMVGVHNFVNNGQLSLVILLTKMRSKLNIELRKKITTTNRESPILIPEKLNAKFKVPDINDTINEVIVKMKVNCEMDPM
jgi:dTDP-4-dehydrorhamnose reductase